VPDVQAALEDFCSRDLNLIVVNSGDGTVQAVLTELMVQRLFAELPLLALLSGGTTNMTHQDLGLSGPPSAALQRVLAWAHHGDGRARIRRRTVLKVQTGSIARPLYGLFFGSACIFNGIRFFHSTVRRTGLRGDAAHLLIVARFLWALARRDDALVAPLPARIQADRVLAEPRDYLLLLVTTLDRLIMGLRPFPEPQEGPLRLTAVSARPRRLLRALPFLIRGRPNVHAQPRNGYMTCSARAIRLDMDGGFAVDGELYTADSRSGPVLIQDGGQVDFLRL
jgi:diacylglycerol kinase family enzyme